ncbi:MAG: hypothetical protein JSV33_10020 [bacterium]|nr:MAG: hypothetical protein JSV33_10020 [bacterium]
MTRRIVIGLILTIALLGLARRISSNRPREIIVEKGALRFYHLEVKEQVGRGRPEVRLMVEPAREGKVYCIYRLVGEGIQHRILMQADGTGRWTASLPDLEKGRRLEYAFVMRGDGGAAVRLPEREDQFLLIKYKGHYSTVVLVFHVLFMFGAFFFMIQCLMGAIGILRGREEKLPTVRMARWVLFCTFIGGWPLGFILNYQRFGPLWEGFPFGFDITDNKTQIIFFIWIVTALLVRGSFFGKGERSDTLGRRAFGWMVVTCCIVSLALYIVPHSL